MALRPGRIGVRAAGHLLRSHQAISLCGAVLWHHALGEYPESRSPGCEVQGAEHWPGSHRSLPATGWTQDFGGCQYTLHSGSKCQEHGWAGLPHRGPGQLGELRGLRSLLVAHNAAVEFPGHSDALSAVQTLQPKPSVKGQLHCAVRGRPGSDHMLYYVSGYSSYSTNILQCHTNHSRITFALYLEKEFSDIMFIMPCNTFTICYAFWINGAFTFLWNFLDFFIVMTSIGLAQRFQQFAARVGALEGRQVPESLWYDIRRDHIRLCELASLVEESMSCIVFVSCANNVYVICNQALAIFTKLRHPINYIYFWYSLLFLMARTSLVFMTASRIHDASLLPLRSLYLVPSNGWTQEVQRFAYQLTSEFVGLSGYRLFCLTRKSLFGMLATLVTYELMLLQMDAKNPKGLRCV
ncbi:gustatory receptor for sugar taste 61a isoform X3 [Drosophila santomea]|uniref:gustatory receptor for sugar taste 61a isoform X3 n=1 Tax=Drosophila santomea TaxID=129105 RepID=UPI00195452DF|nr:gustatory receptor for sugar taste 61a isoform X3 [Drosophila santomea]